MTIDQQRNILYVLKEITEGKNIGASVIDIWDLGVLGNEFYFITSITERELHEKLKEYLQVKEDHYSL